ncbi:hypothetical protein TNCV_2206381 [Trichonephila clavipes]|uniref:Integrase catalytic domain-containing protein n=1 Tax=Trichonephila clavipes TaxID=2585209 RepID=A0A8X6S0G9_TRICX|nr:hypothetical protein TNCV_2206381 [Trichonephila clavipes]
MGTQTWCSKRGRRPLSRNPVDSVEGSQISCAALRALAINSREQFIKEQREDPELGHIYRYLENPDDGSVNATICESWSQDFKLINGLLFTRTRYGAPISLISDNGPQFISDVFEHLSHRLDIKHMKTVRVYRPRQSDTISSDSPIETLYDEQEVSHRSNRSHQGQFKEHRKTSSQESEGYRSRQSNTTREIPRNKRKINSTASKDPAIKRSKICKKRSRQGSDHQDRKRHAPEQRQGAKRSIPSSFSSKNYKFQKHNTSSPGVQSIAGPSKLPDRRKATTTSGSRMEVSGRDNQTRQTRATTRRHNEQ